MDELHKGWFTEFSPDDLERMKSGTSTDAKLMHSDGQPMGGAWPGQAFSLKVKKVLFHEKSKYQDVLIFESETYGNVLVLDGIIQCTERDEFSYQEMLAHLPLFAHPEPRKVLIIGGGDGGILREVVKHACVESVVMCEIDDVVVEAAKKFLPSMSSAFSHPKARLEIGDGFEFLKKHKHEFDVIITDSSDPVGPAESLFGLSYYELVRDALKEGGIVACQGECPWLDLALMARVVGTTRALFPRVAYAATTVPTYTTGYMAESAWLHLPLIAHLIKANCTVFENVRYAMSAVSTYPSGLMGYLIATKSERDLSVPARELTDAEVDSMGLRFYNSSLHRAAFALPQFVKKGLGL